MEQNNDNTSFHDEAPSDRGFNKLIQHAKEQKGNEQQKLAKGIQADLDEDTVAFYNRNIMEGVDEDLEDFDVLEETDEFED
jgi:hypothetical protein